MIRLAVLGLAIGLWASPVGAQNVLELARKEGKVVWYSSLGLSLAQKVCDVFNKKGLGVTCELNRDGSERIFQKVMQEAATALTEFGIGFEADVKAMLAAVQLISGAVVSAHVTPVPGVQAYRQENAATTVTMTHR